MTPPRFDQLLITCEHASNATGTYPFANRPVLSTHRAWDPGALTLARELAKAAGVQAHTGKLTRLLIDLNRREGSKGTFSEYTPEAGRAALLAYHRNWRSAVLADARRLAAKGRLLHVSCHSFTPELHGEVRNAEIGLLYDPRRKLEKATADAWHAELCESLPALRIRRNYPYRGTSDGVTTWLRREIGRRYAGFEIELNQSFAAKPPRDWADVRRALIAAIQHTLGNQSHAERP
ncbi:MAG: N-formylglutamate amidohydrolase [Planctomycetes bacterium]|nr:N-formylglutamate amidohydrolase [Planctomycetota bacterium]